MKRIKELRQAKGLRQVDMAAHFGVGQTAIVKWESEGLYPPSRLLPEIAIYLGCTLDDLFKDEKEREKADAEMLRQQRLGFVR